MAKKSKKLERKLKRKKRRKSFLYQNRKIIYTGLLIVIIVLSVFLFYNYTQIKKEWKHTVGIGDTIEINYIGGYQEQQQPFLTSIVDENATWETKLDDSHQYNSEQFRIGYIYNQGLGRALAKVDEKFLGKKIGDTVEFYIRSEDIFIQGDPSLYYYLPPTAEVERVQSRSLNATLPTTQFTQQFGEPEEGQQIDTLFGKAVVAKVDQGMVTIEFVSGEGEEISSIYGRAVVEEINEKENKIYIKHIPEKGSVIMNQFSGFQGNMQYLPVKVVDVTEEKITFELLKYIRMQAKIEDITKKFEGEWAIEKGDQVLIDYTGKLENGKVFDTTHKDIAEDNSTEKTDSFEKKYNYAPFKIESVNHGEIELFKVFEEKLIGMKTGEEKTITLSPKEAYGEHKEEKIKSIPIKDEVPIKETIKKEEIIPLEEYAEKYGQPLEGKTIITEYGPAEIVEITEEGDVRIKRQINEKISLEYFEAEIVDETEESITLKRIFKESVNTKNGTATVKEHDGKYILTLDVEEYTLGDRIQTEYGEGKIRKITDEEIVVDTNHPLAGETLIYTVKIVKIRKHLEQ